MFGVGFCLCVCLLLIHIVSMEVAGEKYITGLGGADFGDSVMGGMTAATRRVCSSFVSHYGSG